MTAPGASRATRSARTSRTSGTTPLLVASVLALLLGLASAVNPVLGLGVFAAIAGLVAFTRSGVAAVCVFTCLTYGDIVTEYTGPSLSPLKFAGGALIVLAATTLAIRHRRRSTRAGVDHTQELLAQQSPGWRHHPVTVAFVVAFVACALSSAAWAIDLTQVKSLTTRLLTDALIFLAVPVLLRTTRQLRALGWTALGGATAATLIGAALHLNLAGRSIGTFADPNEFAAALVPAMAFGLPLAESAQSTLVRWVGRSAVTVCLIGVVTSGSRGGVLALLVAFAVVLLGSRGRERVRLTGWTLVTIAGVAAWLALTPAASTITARLADHDSSGRTELWTVAVREMRAEPLHGVGLGNYPVRSRYFVDGLANQDLFLRDARTTHSTPLELLAELGIVGLLLYYGFIVGCLAAGVRAIRLARTLGESQLSAAARGMVAGIIAAVAATLFLSNQYQELTWVLCGACIAAYSAARHLATVATARALVDATLADDDAR
ncbi:MAG: O-antigen polymerase [Thermoleophilia bacterium]|nr:O-antigen polymerase [Thermoleophilia bacterium]